MMMEKMSTEVDFPVRCRVGAQLIGILVERATRGQMPDRCCYNRCPFSLSYLLMSDPVDEVSGSRSPATMEPPARPPDSGRRRWSLVIAAWIALALAGTAAWVDTRNAQRDLRVELAKRLATIETDEQATLATQKDTQESLREAQAKVTLLESRLAESQTQQAALEALYRELAPSRDEWALTEIEQVLLLASQQLQLAGNVSSALAALQLADSKLQRLDRPQFTPLRRALARDMDRLKAVPFVDVTGLSLRLDQAIASVDTLPLALEQRVTEQRTFAPASPAAPPDEPAWRRFLRDAWRDLRGLVRIENLDRPELPLLAPQEQFFLRENLKLRLLSARFDLFFRDQLSFRADLAAVDAWLRKYFDTRVPSVQSLLVLVKELQATEMTAEVPDLVRSLEAIRVLKLAREKPLR
jgi:uroporphyrin-III C-methyltransferase